MQAPILPGAEIGQAGGGSGKIPLAPFLILVLESDLTQNQISAPNLIRAENTVLASNLIRPEIRF